MAKVTYKDLCVFSYNKQIRVGIENKDSTKIKDLKTGEIILKTSEMDVRLFQQVSNISFNDLETILDTDSMNFKFITKKVVKEYAWQLKYEKHGAQLKAKKEALSEAYKKEIGTTKDF